jgi:hypothetical protein
MLAMRCAYWYEVLSGCVLFLLSLRGMASVCSAEAWRPKGSQSINKSRVHCLPFPRAVYVFPLQNQCAPSALRTSHAQHPVGLTSCTAVVSQGAAIMSVLWPKSGTSAASPRRTRSVIMPRFERSKLHLDTGELSAHPNGSAFLAVLLALSSLPAGAEKLEATVVKHDGDWMVRRS